MMIVLLNAIVESMMDKDGTPATPMESFQYSEDWGEIILMLRARHGTQVSK